MNARVTCMSMVLLAAWAAPSWGQTPTPTPIDCEAVRCSVQASINACATPVAGQTLNHGRYVSCVTQVIKAADIPTKCKGKVMSCAAHSTFGKPKFETCTIQEFGMCDLSTGMCKKGVLAPMLPSCTKDSDCLRFGACDATTGTCTSGTLASGLPSCTTDSDCLASRCSVKQAAPAPTPDKCTALGGTIGTGSCCAACP